MSEKKKAKKAKKAPKTTGRLPGLRSCPFCGGVATHRSSPDKEHWITCLQCSALSPFAVSKSKAVAGWNRREVVAITS